MGLGIITIGIETKCGMIGYGDIIHILCGHHLDTIDGVIIIMVGIILGGMGIIIGITDLGIIKVIMQYGIEVEVIT
tara:strand:- start:555 stop:782 length:228 start_codon:yes stop_codon:yes gene_type:complete